MAIFKSVWRVQDFYGRQTTFSLDIDATDAAAAEAFAASSATDLAAVMAGELLDYELEAPSDTIAAAAAAGSNVDEELLLSVLTDEGSKVKLSVPTPDKALLVASGALDTGASGVSGALDDLIANVLVSDGETILSISGGQLAKK